MYVRLQAALDIFMANMSAMTSQGDGYKYLQLPKEFADGLFASGVDLASLHAEQNVGLTVVFVGQLLDLHEAFARLQQHAQDHEARLHVSLQQRQQKQDVRNKEACNSRVTISINHTL